MTTARILTQAQAQAVYAAMCALNRIGGFLRTNVDTAGGSLRIEENDTGIHIMRMLRTVEKHADQAAFAAAYGLLDEVSGATTDFMNAIER